MTQVSIKQKFTCLFPAEDWSNPKRHISALIKGGKVVACAESSLGGKLSYHRGKKSHYKGIVGVRRREEQRKYKTKVKNMNGKKVYTGNEEVNNNYNIFHRGRSCHSEISVLKLMGSTLWNRRKISKYTLWNIRWSRNGEIVNSKPCLQCKQVLLQVGIKDVVFSTSQGIFIKANLFQLKCHKSSGFTY